MNIDKVRFSRTDIIVFAACIGIFTLSFALNSDEFKARFIQFMTDNFGKTNNWSATFGAEWMVTIADEISALSSRTVVLLEIAFFSSYFYLIGYKEKLQKFLINFIGALLLLFFLKIIFSNNYSNSSLLPTDGLSFPSGHSMMVIVMYHKIFSLIFPLGFNSKGRVFIFIAVTVLALMVGVSRLIVGAHTPLEVLAGYASGILWTYIDSKYIS